MFSDPMAKGTSELPVIPVPLQLPMVPIPMSYRCDTVTDTVANATDTDTATNDTDTDTATMKLGARALNANFQNWPCGARRQEAVQQK